MRKYVLGAAVIAIVAVASCKKDKNLVKATVIDTGDIATGGCGYLLKLTENGRIVRPSNLPTAYTHDGYKVKVKFDEDGQGFECGIYPKHEFIELVQLTIVKADLD